MLSNIDKSYKLFFKVNFYVAFAVFCVYYMELNILRNFKYIFYFLH